MSATTDQQPDELVIELRKPIAGVAGPVNSLTVREPTAGEMLQWDKREGVDADATAISVVAGMPRVDVDKLPARDFNKAARFIASFLA